MKERIRRSLLLIYQILDLLALGVALWLAFYYGGPLGLDYVKLAVTSPGFDSTLFFVGVIGSWMFVQSSFWLYRSKRLANWDDELREVLRAVGFVTLILATQILLAEWPIFPKRFMLIFAFVSFVLLFAIRLFKGKLLESMNCH